MLEAANGTEATHAGARLYRRVDCSSTDVVMPGLSGRELAARLSIERPNVRVLYMSGYPEKMMERAGFDGGLLLPKPFLPADLLHKVGEILTVAV